MAIRLTSHLHKNRYGVFGFRLVIPRDLRLLFPQNEVRISLRTTNKTIAASLALRLTVVTTNYLNRIRRAPTLDEAMATGKEFLEALSGTTFDSQTEKLEELMLLSDGESKELFQQLVALRTRYSSIKAQKLARFQEMVTQLPSKAESEVDSLFCDMYADLTPLVAEENALASNLNALTLRAQQALQSSLHDQEIEALQESQQAKISEITDLAAEIAAKVTQKAANAQMQPQTPPASPLHDSELLSAVVDEYCANQISEGCWTEKTERENRSIFSLWIRIVGDQPIKGYGHEQHRKYKATLSKLPPNLNKSPKYRGKTIEQILALNAPPAALNTINKNLVRISALFDWAITYDFAEANPAEGKTIKNPNRARDERKLFEAEDLELLFDSSEYQNAGHRHPYQHWLPLLALYTGARLNELCQLHLNDFDVIDGVQVIRISDNSDDKRVKTKAARREIPVHSKLIELGLIERVNTLRNAGQTRLFPELKLRRDGYGHTASKWFARYAKRCGIKESGKVFHSFRHTFINRLKQADIPENKIAALVGHEEGSITFGRYGKSYQPRILQEVIEVLDFQVTNERT